MTNFNLNLWMLALLCATMLLTPSCQSEIMPSFTVSYVSGDGSKHEMDVFYNESYLDISKPTILYFHGGSWVSGTRSKIHQRYREPMLRQLIDKGFIVFSVDYRLVGLGRGYMEGAVSDCRDALSFVLKNADNLGVDTTKIGFWGSSAGAHLAMMTAFADTLASKYVKFVVDDFGPVDIHGMSLAVPEWGRELVSDMIFNLGSKNLQKFDSLISVYSPINYDTKIPVLIFHGEDDNVVDISQSQMLHEHLPNNSHFITFPGNAHGLKNLDSSQLRQYVESFETFMDTVLDVGFGSMQALSADRMSVAK